MKKFSGFPIPATAAFKVTVWFSQIESLDNSEELVDQISDEYTNDNIFYQVPTPNELFAVLKSAEVTYNKECLNDVANSEKYITKSSKDSSFLIR